MLWTWIEGRPCFDLSFPSPDTVSSSHLTGVWSISKTSHIHTFCQCIQSIGNHVNYYSIPIQSMIQSHIPSLFSKPSRYFLNHSINPFNTAFAFWLESSLYLHFF